MKAALRAMGKARSAPRENLRSCATLCRRAAVDGGVSRPNAGTPCWYAAC